MKRNDNRRVMALLGTAALAVSAANMPLNAAPPPSARIAIKDFMFSPVSVKIKAGAAVTWVNQDDEPHTVVSETGLFRSGGVDTHETFVFKFDKPGTYRFLCTIHPKMVGTVVVE